MTEHESSPAASVQRKNPALPSAGEYLRKLREERGLTHSAVGTTLHLTAHYIRALEADEYGKLPALIFVKGYLRAYASFLNADVDGVMAYFEEHVAGLLDAGAHTERVERFRRRQDQALRWAIGAGAVVLAGLLAGWWFMSGDDAPAASSQAQTPVLQQVAQQVAQQTVAARPQPQITAAPLPQTLNAISAITVAAVADPAAAAPEPAESVAEAASATTETATPAGLLANDDNVTITPDVDGTRQVALVSVGADELRVTFNGDSWIEVDNAHRVRLYNDMLHAGDTLTIRGTAPFHVLLGDATQVAVAVNATVIDITGEIRDDSTARLVFGTLAGSVASEEAPL